MTTGLRQALWLTARNSRFQHRRIITVQRPGLEGVQSSPPPPGRVLPGFFPIPEFARRHSMLLAKHGMQMGCLGKANLFGDRLQGEI